MAVNIVAIRTRCLPTKSNMAMNNWHSLVVFGKYTSSIPGSFTAYLERLAYIFSNFLQANARVISTFSLPSYFIFLYPPLHQ
jgi:hypothetical protein